MDCHIKFRVKESNGEVVSGLERLAAKIKETYNVELVVDDKCPWDMGRQPWHLYRLMKT
jgi:hypothetical protein